MLRRFCVVFPALLIFAASASFGLQSDSGTARRTSTQSDNSSSPPAPEQIASSGNGVPKVVRFSSVLRNGEGKSRSGLLQVSFSIYEKLESAAPLWIETQNVDVDQNGHYTVLLGSTHNEGLPTELFSGGEARWIGVQAQGDTEQARTMLVSVPYALKAVDADTLGGKPLSAFLLVDSSAGGSAKSQRLQEGSQAQRETTQAVDNGGVSGTVNFLTKWTTNVNIGDSLVFDNGSNVGIGTNTPTSKLDVNGNIAFSSAPNKAGFAGFNISGDGVFRAGINMPNLLGQGDLTKQGAFFTMDTRSNQNALAIWTKQAGSTTELERVTIQSGGNVGIGNTSPAQLLDIGGNVAVGGNLLLNSSPLNTGMRGFNLSGAGVLRVGVNMPNLLGEGDTGRQGSFFSMDTRAGQSVLSIWTKQPATSTEVERVTVQSAGNVGIGNTSPQFLLDVGGSMRAAGGIVFGDGSTQTTALSSSSVISGSNSTQIIRANQTGAGAGSFSIGTSPPAALRGDSTATSGFVSGVLGTTSSPDGFGVLGENLASGAGTGHSAGVRGITANTTSLGTGVWGDALQLSGDNVGVFGHSASNTGTGVQGWADSSNGDAIGVYGRSDSTGGTGVFGEVVATTAASATLFPAGVYGKIASNAGAAGLFDTTSSGNILIGRSGVNPVNVFRVDSTGKGFFNGSTQVGGADFAESVAVLKERTAYQAGDLMAIDTTGKRRFAKVTEPYSTLVAGIYSTKPGVLATPHNIDDQRLEAEEIPLAMVGIVPCKVTNENGIINAGDLLVSSSIPGYAMKGTDRRRMTGAVVGKALEKMNGSTSVIEVLVSLQ